MKDTQRTKKQLIAELAALRRKLTRLERDEPSPEAADALRIERAYLDELFESAPEAVVLLDPDSRILRANRCFTELFGYSLDEVRGQPVDELLAPEGYHEEAVSLTARVADGEQVSVETVRRRKDGSVVDVSILGTPIRVNGGQVAVYGIYRDITARKRAEREREASLALFNSLVDNMQAGVVVETVDRKIFAVNPAFCRMFAIAAPPETLRGADCAAAAEASKGLLAEPDRFAARIAEIIGRREAIVAEEVAFADGRAFERDYVPIAAADGAFVGHMWQYRDVTERRQLEAELRQAQKMEAIGQLTGGIAHDFNNLLTVIQGNAELIGRDLPNAATELQAEVEDLKAAVQRGASLVKKLLAFSRRQDLLLAPVELGRLCTELGGTLRRLLPENIAVRVVTDTPTGTVRADQNAVEQIVLNLATNARDAMPDGGVFTLQVTRCRWDVEHATIHDWIQPGDYACLAVSDTGVGMDEATLQRLFEPFFTTKPPGVGTGLGMAMIYGLVKQHAGFLDVRSAPDEGTTVQLYFPVVADEEQAPRAQMAVDDADLPGGSETILVVEDEEPIRIATQRLLERYGYRVLVAADGEEGLRRYREQGPAIDLVMTDLVMPKMGGRQLHEVLRREVGEVKTLFLSGYAARDVKERAALEPHLPFVAKPWILSDLLLRIRKVLDDAPRL